MMTADGLALFPHLISGDDGTQVAGEWGRLRVPEVRGKSDSRTIELAFLRLKTESAARKAPVFYLAGGPGSSGIAGGTKRLSRFLRWAKDRDVILLDQRGVNHSRPNLTHPFGIDLPLDEPGTREGFVAAHRNAAVQAIDFWTARGVDPSGYTTAESADDVDDLRRALGYERISPVGYSYGSHLCLSVIRRHGKALDRAIVGGAEGPDHTYKLPSAVDRALAELGRVLRLDPRWAAVMPDLSALLGDLLSRLRRGAQRVTVKDRRSGADHEVTVGAWDLQMAVADTMGATPALKALPGRLVAMSRGDWRWLAETALARRRRPGGNLMSVVMDLASHASPARLARIRDEAAHALLGDAINLPFPDIGDGLLLPDLGEEFRGPLSSDVPVLMHLGTLDGRTPVSNAEELLPGFTTGHLLVVGNGSHDTSWWSGEASPVEDEMTRFLDGGAPTTGRIDIPFAFDAPPAS
jgi:pimeloyl-ACP methyl ester carboxylesterase